MISYHADTSLGHGFHLLILLAQVFTETMQSFSLMLMNHRQLAANRRRSAISVPTDVPFDVTWRAASRSILLGEAFLHWLFWL